MFLRQNKYLPKRRRVFMQKLYHFSCPKCNNNQKFYRYGKDSSGFQKYQCRNCRHQFAPDRMSVANEGVGKLGGRERDPILPALVAESLHFFITTMIFIQTTVVVTRSAIIPCLCQSLLLFQLHPCPSCSVKLTLSVCVTPFTPLSWHCQCFIWAKTLFAISL